MMPSISRSAAVQLHCTLQPRIRLILLCIRCTYGCGTQAAPTFRAPKISRRVCENYLEEVGGGHRLCSAGTTALFSAISLGDSGCSACSLLHSISNIKWFVRLLRSRRALPSLSCTLLTCLVISLRTRQAPTSLACSESKTRCSSTEFRFYLKELIFCLLHSHNSSVVQVLCVSLTPSDGSDVRMSFERYCHQFDDAVGVSDADVAQRINSAGVMLLVDLNGFTHGSRSGVTAMRPAPLTVFDQASILCLKLHCLISQNRFSLRFAGFCWHFWWIGVALE
jgi:hypothetical protein